MQLLTRYYLYRSLHCSSANRLGIKTDRISVALKTSSATWTIALDVLNVFWQDKAYYWSSPKN